MNDSKVNHRAASARRAAQKKAQAKQKESLGGHFWNLVGGALVAVMISGMIYVLNAMVASNLYNHEAAWNVQYFKNIFIAVFFVYAFMPRLLANMLGFIFGSKSKSTGQRQVV
jgi:heme/copper-type cytochrome/quinol oxidase subunit 1